MTTRSKCQSLARKLGCELEYNRRRHSRQVEIYLPAGMKMAGTIDVDALHHECELDEDIWPGVYVDAQRRHGTARGPQLLIYKSDGGTDERLH